MGNAQPVPFSNKLTVVHTVVLQERRDMEGAFPSKCVTAVGCDDVRKAVSVCDGIGVDAEWQHQPVPAARECRSAGACMSFV